MAGGQVHLLAAVVLCSSMLACGADSRSDAPSATVAVGTSSVESTTTAPRATTTSTEGAPPAERPADVEGQVEEAYLRSWDVYTDAMLRLDPSGLAAVYSGPALDARRTQIADLAADRTPARMQVEHDYEIVVLNADDAIVLETYVNHSVLLDATTMQPIEPDPNQVVKREYVLRREPGGWHVAHINATS